MQELDLRIFDQFLSASRWGVCLHTVLNVINGD